MLGDSRERRQDAEQEGDDDVPPVFVVRLLLAGGDDGDQRLGQLHTGAAQLGALDGRLSLVESEPLLTLQVEVGRSGTGLRRREVVIDDDDDDCLTLR